jgi:ABC-type sugar transport system ATPase subunit
MTDITPQASPDNVISAVGLVKAFGGIMALAEASLTVRRGTIHALVGENGAGKSTALGALAGRLTVDAGHITIDGKDATGVNPREARALGVGAIYQELTIIPALTASRNVYLGQTPARAGLIAKSEINSRYAALCKRVGVKIPADVRAGDLSVADEQMLEIMRALESGSRIILLDEPTASLVQTERDNLFRIMRELRTDGVTMVLVSHNLDEVLDICDDVTVFRNGRTVATAPASALTKNVLVGHMLGEAAEELLLSHRATEAPTDEVIRVEGLNVPGILDGISLHARRGEILGVAGLVGSGRTTLLRALAGLESTSRGTLAIDGKSVPWPSSPRAALRAGVALVPEDRKGQGLLLHMSSRENVGIANLRRYSRFGLVKRRQMRQEVGDLVERYSLDPSRIEDPVRQLSGGNQQKVLLARWQMKNPRVFLADEPTRGIDVGAKASILASLRAFANAGATVIVVSSELEELTSLADRVVVLSHGSLVGEFDAGDSGVGVDRMLSAAFGSD